MEQSQRIGRENITEADLELRKMRKTIFKGREAPDFELSDLNRNRIRLSNFRGEKVVLLAFLRGFM